MKYLTKDWYQKMQLTGLYHGLNVHPEADSDSIYERLYKEKEQAFIAEEQEMYNLDPRIYLDGSCFTPLEEILGTEFLQEAETIVIEQTEEEIRHIETRIKEYDARPPFDTELCKQHFRERIERQIFYMKEKLPSEIYNRIKDIRIFALGYCTSEIYADLKKFSMNNQNDVDQAMEEYARVRRLHNIPESISRNFNFHDCRVVQVEQSSGQNYIIHLDPSGGFTDKNKVTFVNAKVIKEEPNITGSSWIYDEIYSTSKGYEVHMLFYPLSELTLQCEEILIEKEEKFQAPQNES